MTYAWKDTHPRSAEVFNVAWVIDAPWAHPIWSQYVLWLYDLTSDFEKPPTIHLPGATHEFMLFALDPEHPVPRDQPPSETKFKPLTPANYGYQFVADSNQAAEERIQELVDGIVAKKLSPDTDFRSLWDKLLPDMHSLVY
ncbi:hypothetical protein EVB27_100 [Rhizobium phage RHph_TM16]|nr:hypothetical protein EVB27_100 [Rhizobium phage RHph_TM16]